MSKKEEELFIGTHARVLLSDWHTLADLVEAHAKLIKEQTHTSTEEAATEKSTLPHVISRREIEDAIQGPMQGFFKQKLTAYMKLSLVRMNLNLMEDDTIKDRRGKLPEKDKVPDSILKNTSQSDLSNIQQELDQKTTADAKAWEQLRETSIQQILQSLKKHGPTLSEIEVKEFMDPEPISELLDRYVALNIDLPKTKKTDMNFSKYLTLKANVAIQSALSRQHLPHDSPDIQKILGKLKSDFNTIEKEESQLLNEQKNSTDQIVANISW